MARKDYSPEYRAQLVAEVLAGGAVATIATREKIARSTLTEWVESYSAEVRKGHESVTRPHAERMGEAINSLFMDAITMLRNQAQVAGDKEFVKKNPLGALELGARVLERCDRLDDLVRNAKADAFAPGLPAPDPGRRPADGTGAQDPDALDGDVVDDDPA